MRPSPSAELRRDTAGLTAPLYGYRLCPPLNIQYHYAVSISPHRREPSRGVGLGRLAYTSSGQSRRRKLVPRAIPRDRAAPRRARMSCRHLVRGRRCLARADAAAKEAVALSLSPLHADMSRFAAFGDIGFFIQLSFTDYEMSFLLFSFSKCSATILLLTIR